VALRDAQGHKETLMKKENAYYNNDMS